MPPTPDDGSYGGRRASLTALETGGASRASAADPLEREEFAGAQVAPRPDDHGHVIRAAKLALDDVDVLRLEHGPFDDLRRRVRHRPPPAQVSEGLGIFSSRGLGDVQPLGRGPTLPAVAVRG